MLIYILFILTTLCSARPERLPLREGEIRNFKGQKRFTFNSNDDNLKGSTQKSYEYKYDIELKDEFHSLDEEEYIEDVKCFEDHLEIYSTTKDPLEWKSGDSLSGSEMWKCDDVITRKIVYVDYEGTENDFHKFYIQTESAGFSDFFTNAKVEFNNHLTMAESMNKMKQVVRDDLKEEMNDDMNKENVVYLEDVPEEKKGSRQSIKSTKKSELKGGVTFEFLSPRPKAFSEMSEGIVVHFRISGCTSNGCSRLKIILTLTKVLTGFDEELGFAEINFNCGTSGECVGRYRLTTQTSQTQFYENNMETYFYVTVEDSNGNTLIDELDLEDDYFYLNSYFVAFTYPQGGETIPRETTKISFVVPDRVKTAASELDIHFCKSQIGLDDCGVYTTVTTSKGYINIDLSDTTYFKPGCQYYLKTEIEGFTTEGNIWTLAPVDPPVVVTSPLVGSHYSKGETLEITWICNGDSSMPITLTLKESIPFLVDSTIIEVETTCGRQKYTTTVNSNFEPSTDYYVDIMYDCGVVLCEHATSEYFSINTPQRIQLLRTQHDEENQKITVYYKVSENLGNIYVNIRQQYPTILPLNLRLSGTSEKTVSSYLVLNENSITFSYDEGSIFKTFVEFKYDCVIGNSLCTSEKYTISDNDIPYTTAFGYNINEDMEIIESEIVQYNVTCSNETNDFKGTLKKLCDKFSKGVGGHFELSGICRNCYLSVPIGLKNFVLDMDLLEIKRMHLEVETGIDYYLQFINTFKGSFSIEKEIALPKIGYIPNKEFSLVIGPVTLKLGPKLGFFVAIGIEGELMLQTTTTYGNKHILTFIFDSKATEQYRITATTQSESADNNLLDIHGTAALTITPELRAKIGFVFNFNDFNFVNTEAVLALGYEIALQFSYPPFPASAEYGTSYRHFIRSDNTIYLRYDADYTFLNKISGSKADKLFSFTNKYSFLEYPSGDDPLSFILDITRALTSLEKSILNYEIGLLVQKLGYSNFNPYDVASVKDGSTKRSTGKGDSAEGSYSFKLMSSSASPQMIKDVVNEIERIQKSSTSEDSFIYSLKNDIKVNNESGSSNDNTSGGNNTPSGGSTTNNTTNGGSTTNNNSNDGKTNDNAAGLTSLLFILALCITIL